MWSDLSNNVGRTNKITIEDVVIGVGSKVIYGNKITIDYIAKLRDGTVYDNTIERGIPYTFYLGLGEGVMGMDMGIYGMRVGGIRKLKIPPRWAYTSRGRGPGIVPKYATIYMTIHLLAMEPTTIEQFFQPLDVERYFKEVTHEYLTFAQWKRKMKEEGFKIRKSKWTGKKHWNVFDGKTYRQRKRERYKRNLARRKKEMQEQQQKQKTEGKVSH